METQEQRDQTDTLVGLCAKCHGWVLLIVMEPTSASSVAKALREGPKKVYVTKVMPAIEARKQEMCSCERPRKNSNK